MKIENLGIPALRTGTQTKLCTTDKDKAQALNEQFQSVFSSSSSDNIPEKGPSNYLSTSHLKMHEGVTKQLENLNPTKASDPDEVSPRLLKSVEVKEI